MGYVCVLWGRGRGVRGCCNFLLHATVLHACQLCTSSHPYMQSTAVKVDHGSWTSWLARVTGLTSDRGRRFNDLCGTAEAWDVPSGRWAVRVASGQLIKVRPENLVLLREHRSTVEPATAAEARELLSATSASVASSGGDCAFGEYALPAEVALLYIFPLLTRHTVAYMLRRNRGGERSLP